MRERLSSRLGFLMLAAGCAVGLGNVWRFPFVVGRNGGAAFVLVYLLFLAVLGYPLLAAELAIGRAAKKGISSALPELAKTHNSVWRVLGYLIFAGNFLLMFYYTDVAGWLIKYSRDYVTGVPGEFEALVADKECCTLYLLSTIALATITCFIGVVKGVERVTKVLMLFLLALLGMLAVKALTLDGAAEGLKFYLYPDWSKFMAHPWKSISEAMGQAFFTLSVGVGCMTIFGSYSTSRHTIMKDAAWIVVIDTLVAFISGLVIFPACLTYGVEPSSGPGLIFKALPEVFLQMNGGRLWGFLFFLFLAFAALTTVIAVFECMIGGICDIVKSPKISRRVVSIMVGACVFIASIPCVLWDGVLEFEDFVLSELWLPIGSLAICLFVSWNFGWGWNKFRHEVSDGNGFALPHALKLIYRLLIPVLIATILARI